MKDRLVSRDYCFILLANFLLYFGFFLLMPVLPFYLVEEFGISKGMIGVILACYTVAALTVRPFSGYLLDTLQRKPLYLFSFFIFTMIFGGYIVTGSLAVFIMLRIVHGLSFGTVTVAGNTIVIDITPSSRRGEALGYYGLANNIAMALGPMTGLFMHGQASYPTIFLTGMAFSVAGLLCAICVKARTPESIKARRAEKQLTGVDTSAQKRKLSLDRFILVKGIPVSIALLMLSIPYGATTNFVAMYAKEIHLDVASGFFFTLMAAGMGASRLVAGKKVDQGYVTQCIHFGLYPVVAAFFILSMCRFVAPHSMGMAEAMFFAVPLLLGIGFGIIFPAMNTLYINLAPNNQRATATSTYLTAWDVGIGIGIATSGFIAQHFTFYMVYLIGSALCLISMVYFNTKVTPHYNMNKMR